jgi:formylglycine-generating enzyme required for sulfatase activity
LVRLHSVVLLLFLGPAATQTPPAPPATNAPPIQPVAEQKWTNSLGMKFVPAGTPGVLFSVWDVRVKDYAAFVKDSGQDWPKPGFTQTDNDPAVEVSWLDAHAFCDWLTKKEQTAGLLAPNQKYRLPTDAEWSKAVGLENEGPDTPKDKDGKIEGVYPWGNQWPPPKGAGNYCGEEVNPKHPDWSNLAGYNDGYTETSPVGSFAANAYGLYDMGGDVWQWCEDKFPVQEYPALEFRVLRGASWHDDNPHAMLSSYRAINTSDNRNDDDGFRCVLVVAP